MQQEITPTSKMNTMTSHSVEEVDYERFWKVKSLGIEKMEPEQPHDSNLNDYQSTSITFKNGKYYVTLKRQPPSTTEK